MKIITPIDIYSANMDSSIAEPDLSQGEAEWVKKSNEITSLDITMYRFDYGGGFTWAIESAVLLVYKLDYEFNVISSFSIAGQVASPGGITYQNGHIYVLDFFSNLIFIYTEAGAYTGASFSIAAQTTSADAIASSEVSVYVAYNFIVYVYDLSGLFLTSFATAATSVGGIGYSNNEIFILSSITRRVYRHSSIDYSDIGSFPIYSAISVSVGCASRDGKVYTGNTTNDGIYVYSTIGAPGDYYDIGDQVVVSSAHKKYEAVAITDDSPIDGVNATSQTWVEVSATNKFAMFDYKINTQSIMPATGIITFTPGETCTNVALFGLEDITRVYVQVREDNLGGAIIYDKFQDTAIDSPIEDSLVNDDFLADKLLFDDLPVYATPFIRITFESSVTDIKVGDIVIGNARSLGVVNYQSSTSRTSYDTVKIDTFGNEVIVSRPSAEYTSFEVSVTPQFADYVERILKGSLNQPRVWVGTKANDERLFTFGRYERSPIIYSSPSKYDTNLKIRGLV